MLAVTSPQNCEYRRKPANKLTLNKMNTINNLNKETKFELLDNKQIINTK
jgi:hypothetical protein